MKYSFYSDLMEAAPFLKKPTQIPTILSQFQDQLPLMVSPSSEVLWHVLSASRCWHFGAILFKQTCHGSH